MTLLLTTRVVVEVVVGVVVGEIVGEIVGVVMGGVSENEICQVKNYNHACFDATHTVVFAY